MLKCVISKLRTTQSPLLRHCYAITRNRRMRSSISITHFNPIHDYFFKKQVLRTMLLPSILQSTCSGSSVRRMLFTLVPRLITIDEPFTLRSLITVTASPSNSSAPLLSLGTESVAAVLLEAAPKRMVYVSCNPASQARDLAILSEKYEITAVRPVDMFPHTHHVENVVALKLK